MPESHDAPDHYATLLVEPTATPEEISAAWRMRVRAVHPDHALDPLDEERRTAEAAQVNAAYTVLRDPASRAAYDLERGIRAQRRADAGDPRRAAAREAFMAQRAAARAARRDAHRAGVEPDAGAGQDPTSRPDGTPAGASPSSGAGSIITPIIGFADWLLRDALGQWIAYGLLCVPFLLSVVSNGHLADVAPMFIAWLLILGFAQVLRVGRFAGTPLGITSSAIARAIRAWWGLVRG